MKKKPTKKAYPKKKAFVRSIYGIGDSGKKTLLYRDEIVYTIRDKYDEGKLALHVFNESVEMMNEKIKLEVTEGKV